MDFEDCQGFDAWGEIYLPKFSAALSIIGSALIIAEVVQDMRSSRGATATSRLLFSMSLADILYSLGWFMGTWVMPPDAGRNCGEKHGSEATCTLQAAMLQFGGTASVLFGTALAFVFLLLTRTHSREAHASSSRAEKILQLVVWVVSVISALIFIPFNLYHPAGPVCYISEQIEVCDSEDPDYCWYVYSGNSGHPFNILLENIPVVLAVFLPVVVCVLMNIIFIGAIYFYVRGIEARIKEASQSRRLSITTRQSLTARETILEQSSKAAEQRMPSSYIDDVEENRSSMNGSQESESDGEDQTLASSESQQQRRSIMVAKQGMWYIVGFFGTFGSSFVSGFYYVINNESNETLDNWSYFFLALQGFWNFIIFSRRRDMKTIAGVKARGFVWNQGLGVICFYKLAVDCLSKKSSLCGKNTGPARDNAQAVDSAPIGQINPHAPLNNPNEDNNLRGHPTRSDSTSKLEKPSQCNSKVSWKSSLVSELGASKLSIATPCQDWGDTIHTQDRSPAKPNRYPSDVYPNSELDSQEDSEEKNLNDSDPATPQELAPSSDIDIDPDPEFGEGDSVSSQEIPFVVEENTLSTITNSVTDSEAQKMIHKVGKSPMTETYSAKKQKQTVSNLLPKVLPTLPSRDNRTISELTDSIGCYDIEEDDEQAAAPIGDPGASQQNSSPAMPLRVASEIEEQALTPTNNSSVSQRSCPPKLPTRVVSETE